MDKVLHHGQSHQDETQQGGAQGAKTDQPQKEGAMDKFKDYIAEDVKEEKEGKTYGGLM